MKNYVWGIGCILSVIFSVCFAVMYLSSSEERRIVVGTVEGGKLSISSRDGGAEKDSSYWKGSREERLLTYLEELPRDKWETIDPESIHYFTDDDIALFWDGDIRVGSKPLYLSEKQIIRACTLFQQLKWIAHLKKDRDIAEKVDEILRKRGY
jgi:hypothetical protein